MNNKKIDQKSHFDQFPWSKMFRVESGTHCSLNPVPLPGVQKAQLVREHQATQECRTNLGDNFTSGWCVLLTHSSSPTRSDGWKSLIDRRRVGWSGPHHFFKVLVVPKGSPSRQKKLCLRTFGRSSAESGGTLFEGSESTKKWPNIGDSNYF